MTLRHYVPPPGVAPAPNVAPGREFWANRERTPLVDVATVPIAAAVVDLTKPNLTREALAATYYALYLNQGNDDATARSLADARALVMVP